MNEEKYRVWSREHNGYWIRSSEGNHPGGLTNVLNDADYFTADELSERMSEYDVRVLDIDALAAAGIKIPGEDSAPACREDHVPIPPGENAGDVEAAFGNLFTAISLLEILVQQRPAPKKYILLFLDKIQREVNTLTGKLI